jgi:hypothetical protein
MYAPQVSNTSRFVLTCNYFCTVPFKGRPKWTWRLVHQIWLPAVQAETGAIILPLCVASFGMMPGQSVPQGVYTPQVRTGHAADVSVILSLSQCKRRLFWRFGGFGSVTRTARNGIMNFHHNFQIYQRFLV